MSTSEEDAKRGVYRSFISYIDRTREFYAAQGYERPYCWAQFDDAPFTPLPGPLSELRVTLVTTASPVACATENARCSISAGDSA